MFLLDTNVISEIRKIPLGKADPHVELWTLQRLPTDLFLSSIVLLELKQGSLMARHKGDIAKANALDKWIDQRIMRDFKNRILAVTEDISLICATLHVPNQRDKHDALIAATALAHHFVLVTRNGKDFEGIANLKTINPFLPL